MDHDVARLDVVVRNAGLVQGVRGQHRSGRQRADGVGQRSGRQVLHGVVQVVALLPGVVESHQVRRPDGGERGQFPDRPPEGVLAVRPGEHLHRHELGVDVQPVRAAGEIEDTVVTRAKRPDEAVVGDSGPVGREARIRNVHGCLLSCWLLSVLLLWLCVPPAVVPPAVDAAVLSPSPALLVSPTSRAAMAWTHWSMSSLASLVPAATARCTSVSRAAGPSGSPPTRPLAGATTIAPAGCFPALAASPRLVRSAASEAHGLPDGVRMRSNPPATATCAATCTAASPSALRIHRATAAAGAGGSARRK